MKSFASDLNIAVLLPCYNEEAAITQTVKAFAAALPSATIYVFDNNSSDATAELAEIAGAVVFMEPYQGKGNVVRRMFADIDADVYVMADGDATYDATAAPRMVERLVEGNFDMINGARRHTESVAYRRGHQFGNRLLTGLVQLFFSRRFEDMLSGYRVFSRRFVKSFPAMSHGFEIETELTVHALQMRLPAAEVITVYNARPENSASKLSTFKDGFRILAMIGFLVKEERPLSFFSSLAILMFVPSLFVFISVLNEFLETGAVDRMPSMIVALAGFMMAALSLVCALVLDMMSRGRREARRLRYLEYPAPRLALCQPRWETADVRPMAAVSAASTVRQGV